MKQDLKPKISFIFSMFVFGSIGVFRRNLPFGSGTIAFSRGIIGALFLLFVLLMKRQNIDKKAIKMNAPVLCLSGALIGFNWILLFEAYNYTTVATATLCYYTAPIIVIILSPFALKEKLTVKKGLCVAFSLIGMVLVSGVFRQSTDMSGNGLGILCGLGAAVLYAAVILLNKRLHDIGAYDKTIVQLFAASIVILPYTLLKETVVKSDVTVKTVTILLIVGVIHTGLSYALYFGSMEKLSAQTVSLMSYIDPIVALVLSALLLREHMGIAEIIGAVLILGSTVVGEVDFGKEKT
ncbi:MAG: DMT family transporter [Acutalibacteraceae bacterium]